MFVRMYFWLHLGSVRMQYQKKMVKPIGEKTEQKPTKNLPNFVYEFESIQGIRMCFVTFT